jgi:DNA repair protein RecO (recombination protein O)
MPLVSLKGIVLHTRPWKEQDKLVLLYTREQGKLSAMARGGRKPHSGWGAALEPLTVLDFLLFEKGGGRLIVQWQIEQSHAALRSDLSAMAVALYWTELLAELAQENDPNPRVYQELTDALSVLQAGLEPVVTNNAFLLKLLSLLGFWPRLDSCASCGKPVSGKVVTFNPKAGGVLCPQCQVFGKSITVRAATLARARALVGFAWEDLHPDPETDDELQELLRLFLGVHLEKGFSPVLTFFSRLDPTVMATPARDPNHR